MKRQAIYAHAAIVFSFLLAGCHHTGKGSRQTVPTPLPEVGPVMVSVPPPTHHDRPEEPAAVTPVTAPVHEQVHRPARQAKKSALPGASPQAAIVPTAPVASPPIALGELSAGGELSSGLRQETTELLRSQQQRLDAIGHNPPANHATEIAQARAFLQRANASWSAADYEGAHTLAIKAKVLLDDLK